MEDEKITINTRLKSFFQQCNRVWHLLKKPDKTEFLTIAKVSAIGLLLIGAIGFVVSFALKLSKIS
jgi:protein transport protein SEC61 subunit gamma-like protein